MRNGDSTKERNSEKISGKICVFKKNSCWKMIAVKGRANIPDEDVKPCTSTVALRNNNRWENKVNVSVNILHTFFFCVCVCAWWKYCIKTTDSLHEYQDNSEFLRQYKKTTLIILCHVILKQNNRLFHYYQNNKEVLHGYQTQRIIISCKGSMVNQNNSLPLRPRQQRIFPRTSKQRINKKEIEEK